jgi:hypothetical protein
VASRRSRGVSFLFASLSPLLEQRVEHLSYDSSSTRWAGRSQPEPRDSEGAGDGDGGGSSSDDGGGEEGEANPRGGSGVILLRLLASPFLQ